MTTILLDLDNTIVDRSAAFGRWGRDYIAELGGDAEDLAWLLTADENGYAARSTLARGIRNRFSMDDTNDLNATDEALVLRLMYEHVNFVEVYPGVLERLRRLAGAGARLVIVTNGTEVQQSMKIERTGLGSVVHATIISETVGAKKPDRAIFAAALQAVGGCAGEAWMVGDHHDADIAGARDAGLRTGWVSHDASWNHAWLPTVSGRRTMDVLDEIERVTP